MWIRRKTSQLNLEQLGLEDRVEILKRIVNRILEEVQPGVGGDCSGVLAFQHVGPPTILTESEVGPNENPCLLQRRLRVTMLIHGMMLMLIMLMPHG